jgi:hypothetical protein
MDYLLPTIRKRVCLFIIQAVGDTDVLSEGMAAFAEKRKAIFTNS